MLSEKLTERKWRRCFFLCLKDTRQAFHAQCTEDRISLTILICCVHLFREIRLNHVIFLIYVVCRAYYKSLGIEL